MNILYLKIIELSASAYICGMKQGHTSRDGSGVLHLKSAIAGMDSDSEGCRCAAVMSNSVLRSGPYAIIPHEPCQAGNRAALSDTDDVP